MSQNLGSKRIDPNADLDPDADGEWIAIHIYYSANPQALLTECISKILTDLSDAGLVRGYFFINYWLEGPHVRLRLRPTKAGDSAEVCRVVEAGLDEFLQRRPALYEVESGSFLLELYSKLFELELDEEEQKQYLNDDGEMRLVPNNTYEYRRYQPELGKYGGTQAIELAEWHFKFSADMVINATKTMNLHLRNVVLGTSSQIMMAMCASLKDDLGEIAEFLDLYHKFWTRSFGEEGYTEEENYQKAYDEVADQLAERFDQVWGAVQRDELDTLPGWLRQWVEHLRELRGYIEDLAKTDGLTFRLWDGVTEREVHEPHEALNTLLFPFMHMTNNRLHVTIRDEAYLAYVLARTLREKLEVSSQHVS